MDAVLIELQQVCDRAARELLAIEGWCCPKSKVKKYIDEIRAGSKVSSSALSWFLRQTATLPVQAEPARRLNDLVQAVTMLHAWEAAESRRSLLGKQ